jgi:hypothetical protein
VRLEDTALGSSVARERERRLRIAARNWVIGLGVYGLLAAAAGTGVVGFILWIVIDPHDLLRRVAFALGLTPVAAALFFLACRYAPKDLAEPASLTSVRLGLAYEKTSEEAGTQHLVELVVPPGRLLVLMYLPDSGVLDGLASGTVVAVEYYPRTKRLILIRPQGTDAMEKTDAAELAESEH